MKPVHDVVPVKSRIRILNTNPARLLTGYESPDRCLRRLIDMPSMGHSYGPDIRTCLHEFLDLFMSRRKDLTRVHYVLGINCLFD